MPSLYDVGSSHKYLSLLFPDRIDDYHTYGYQAFHHVRLLIPPPETRYAAAQAFVVLAQMLDEPVQRASSILKELHGDPYPTGGSRRPLTRRAAGKGCARGDMRRSGGRASAT